MLPSYFRSGKASEARKQQAACIVSEAASASLPSSVCVFCGARFGADPAARQLATDLGELLAHLSE